MFGAALCQTSAPQSTLNRHKRSLRWLGRAPISVAMETSLSIAIKVNGEQRRVPAGLSVAAMLGELGLDPRKVAVERNLEIVPRAILDEMPVEDGDSFEIVHFVGGG
jgi:thiazole synthase